MNRVLLVCLLVFHRDPASVSSNFAHPSLICQLCVSQLKCRRTLMTPHYTWQDIIADYYRTSKTQANVPISLSHQRIYKFGCNSRTGMTPPTESWRYWLLWCNASNIEISHLRTVQGIMGITLTHDARLCSFRFQLYILIFVQSNVQ